MRLWHKDLIPYLPRLQLIAQYRECNAICSNWVNKGTPNHILVNKVMNYPTQDFFYYRNLVVSELKKRGYKLSSKSINNFDNNFEMLFCREVFDDNNNKPMFEGWHNERYLKQCLMNLQEKYDCGGISEDEWKIIENKFRKYL